ncbi:50S ribosomal protein L11 methyltransferase [Mameliella sp.]|uniref:50S ribosomal protein L11 methyltransferase n=1 Tax=Mameliella sp. TaxID=1924940 RepID=UPI003B505829
MNYGTYSVASYGRMIRNSPRMTAYAKALRSVITPGCTVLDLGAGFGFFSLLACQYGAGRVIAVEPAGAIELGPELARANGCADRITFVRGVSRELGEDCRADVIIADLRGSIPLFTHHIPTIVDARTRLLAPEGVLVTQRDRLRCALVSDGSLAEQFDPWDTNPFGVDLSLGRRFSVANTHKVSVTAEAQISDAADLGELDYARISDPSFSGEVTLSATRAAQAHGVLVWFDAELAGGFGFSNAPEAPPLTYGQLFLPFEHPVDMSPGDTAEVSLDFCYSSGGYPISWKSRITRAGTPDLRYAQSTALSDFVTAADLRRRSGSYCPPVSASMELDRYCLARFDGATPLSTIAREVVERAPDRFQTEAEALVYVADLAERYHAVS